MITPVTYNLQQLRAIADAMLEVAIVHITDAVAPYSEGTAHDFYSNGDYWWPNPDTADGLPYVCRDGQTNPGNFTAHRKALRRMRFAVTHLAMAYRLTGEEQYADRAVTWLQEFFLDGATRMLPHLTYAQAIPGVCPGRGIGIIDTLHLIDLPQAMAVLRPQMEPSDWEGLKRWFAEYLNWMNTHPNGIEEREWHNNHSVTWFAQAASFARFTEDEEMLQFCRRRYKEVLLPGQMDRDGSFPHELERTKPYNYSCFVLDNMAAICLFASSVDDNLWDFKLADGRGIKQGLQFMFRHLKDKSSWPYGRDQEHDEVWPVAMPFMLFGGICFEDEEYIKLWNGLEQYPPDEEIRRNISIRCPWLFLDWKDGKAYELLRL